MPVEELPLSTMARRGTPQEKTAQRQALADGLMGLMQQAGEAMAALQTAPGTTLEGRAQLAAVAADGLRAQSAVAHWVQAAADSGI